MRLNKKGKNFLLGTLLKGYFVQLVICSVVVMIGTIVLDLVASSLSRRWFGELFFWYYRALYAFEAGVVVWALCIIWLTYRLIKKWSAMSMNYRRQLEKCLIKIQIILSFRQNSVILL